MDSDVIVVGGGLTGLAAAAYVARTGRRVVLFEQTARPGGRASTDDRAGYQFNRGGHALYTGGPASQVLGDLGVSYTAGVPKAVFAFKGGQLQRVPATPATLLSSGALSGLDKLELLRFFARLATLHAEAFGTMTVQDWLDQTLRRPAVRELIGALARTALYTAAVDVVSADVLISRLQLALSHPLHYVNGGWQTLVDGLARRAVEHGAAVVCGAHVEAVEAHDGHVEGVRLRDGRRLRAAAVIIATPPHDAAQLLGRPVSALARHALPAQVACLDLGLRYLPHPDVPVVQHLEHPLFVSVQSRYSRLAPPGAALVHVLKQLDPRVPTDPHADERELEAFLDQVQPGWREAVVERIYLPRITATPLLPVAEHGGLAARPNPRVPGLGGAFVAGDWVGPDGYLADASLASARQTARLVLSSLVTSVERGDRHEAVALTA